MDRSLLKPVIDITFVVLDKEEVKGVKGLVLSLWKVCRVCEADRQYS